MVAMVAYEFYRFDKLKGRDLIAILPERRRTPERISEESVMKWVRKFLDEREDPRNIFFVKVMVSEFEAPRKEVVLWTGRS